MSGRHLLSAAALLAAGSILATSAFAQSSTGTGGNAIVVSPQGPGTGRAAATAALRRKTASQGTTRVIVGLKRTLRSPDGMLPAEAAAQSGMIQAAQNALLGRVFGSSSASADASRFEYIPFVVMNVNVAQLDRVLADPDVANIQQDVALAPSLAESVPRIQADTVANAGFPGTGIAVAILDTGVDNVHSMFPRFKIVSQACYSSNIPAEGATSVCPGGVLSSIAAGSGVNCALNISGCDHGTHVAGIAAGNSGSPFLRGVAYNSRIIAIQVFSRVAVNCAPNPSPCAQAYTADIIKGLERVYALRNSYTIAAANLSLGRGLFNSPCDAEAPALTTIIRMLRDARIATVIAAGNRGNPGLAFPACISEAIAVGSTLDNADTWSSFSNYTELVRLLAPGSDITSSVPDFANPQNAMGDKSGTSMATPHVAGAFALLRDVRAGSTVDDIAAALECTGVGVKSGGITERRIDVDAARAYLLAPPSATKSFTFATAAQREQWTPHTGTWSVAGGRYNLTARSTKAWQVSTTDSCNESQTITAVLKRNWPAGDRSYAGIVFKVQITQFSTTKKIAGYAAFISRDLPGKDLPNVTLWRLDGLYMAGNSFNPDPYAYVTMLCSADLDIITSGVFYNLKVVTTGGLHKVFVNNVLQCQATDRSYGTGRAGVITYVGATGAANAFNIESFTIDPTEVVPPAAQMAAQD